MAILLTYSTRYQTMSYENLFEDLHHRSDDELSQLRAGLQETLEQPDKLLSFLRIQMKHIDLILKYRARYGKKRHKKGDS